MADWRHYKPQPPVVRHRNRADVGGWAHLTFLHRHFQPGRAKENSPAFQRWDTGPQRAQVPSGTAERQLRRQGALSSLTGLAPPARLPPSVETPGYSLSPCRAEGKLARNRDAPWVSGNLLSWSRPPPPSPPPATHTRRARSLREPKPRPTAPRHSAPGCYRLPR